jgi:ATP-binding cassette subfamily B protein
MKTNPVRSLSFLKRYLLPYKGTVILALISLSAASAVLLALGGGVRSLIDHGLDHENHNRLSSVLLGLSGGILVLAVASFGRSYCVSWLGERIVSDLRQDVFRHILSLDVGFYEQTRAGELISRLTNDATLIQVLVGTSAAIAVRNFMLFTGGLVMMGFMSPKLTLYCLGIVPLVLVPIIVLGRKVRFYSRIAQDRTADLGGYIDECLNNIRTVQAFTHEAIDKLIFKNYSASAFHAAVQRNFARGLLAGFVMVLIFSAISFVLWLGMQDVWNQTLTMGDLSAFLFYAIVVAGSAGSLSEIMADLQRAAGGADRLLAIFQVQHASLQRAAPSRALPEKSRGILAMHNVCFAYPSYPERLVLNHATLSVSPGENLAIVGPSGAGKSTVFSLLLRFYDPQSGSIHLDGVDIKDVSVTDLRRRIGVVSQEPALFSTTIYENILYGRPDATESDVMRAAHMVRVQDFLPHLPNGMETLVGVRGVRLSGGQKQRIAIARAILRDPSLLLLDEATNSLDAESEHAVQEGLKHLMSTRTSIVIAHRLATVLKAHRIVVIDEGSIQAVGTHAELITSNALYRRLATLQFADAAALGAQL